MKVVPPSSVCCFLPTQINHDTPVTYTIIVYVFELGPVAQPFPRRTCAAERAPTLLRAAPAALRAEREVEMFAFFWI